jgi:hypothetical protein
MVTGSCLCGSVQYEVSGPFDMMAHCHCSMCRKHHGAMFSTFVAAPLAGFRYSADEELIRVFQSSEQGRRPFCSRCGSVSPTVMKDMDLVLLPAGNLQDVPGARPQMHMFAASRASWFPITDALPQHAGFPPQFGGGDGIARTVPPALPGITRGSCLCSAVAWEFTGQPERVQNCHCTRCRRARSAAFGTNAFYRKDQLSWTRGPDQVVNYALPDARRFGQAFCGQCGGKLPRVVESTGYVVAPCGSLDDAPGLSPAGNVFATSKAGWYEITDGLPQWEAYPARS